MPKYPFSAIVENIKDKRMPVPEDQYSYIGLEHLDSDRFVVSRQGSPAALKGSKLIMKQGDILFGKRNAYLRRVAIAPHDGLFSAHGMIFRPKKAIDPSFAPFFLRSDKFMQTAIDISVGSISPTVNWSDLKDIQFDLPPLSRQKELAKVLWAIEKTAERYESLLSKCDELVKSRFVEAFGNCPQKPIGSIFQTKSGGTPSTKVDEYYDNGNVPWLTSSEIHQGYIEKPHNFITTLGMENSSAKMVPAESVVIAMYGATVGAVGLLKYASTMNQAICALLPNDLFEPVFVFHALSALKDTFLEQTVGGGQPNISQVIIKKTLFPVPPLGQQKEFIGFTAQIDKLKFVSRINSRFLRNGMLCRRHRCL